MRHIPMSAVEDAASAIYSAVVRTPLVRLHVPVSTPAGEPVEVYLKLECLQPIGSFKLRGAMNAVRQLTPAELAGGVWTVSAGNAAQGVAYAARTVGAPCSVLVMDTAPDTKVRAIVRLGATIVRATYDECWRTVETHRSDRMHGHFVHPFDDDAFIAGNATAGLEILGRPARCLHGRRGYRRRWLLGPGAVMHARRPDVRVVAAELETAALLAQSLAAARRNASRPGASSFVDGAGGNRCCRRCGSCCSPQWPSRSSTLDDAACAMALVADRVHVIIEGAARGAAAAALSGRAGAGKVVAVISGGNIDLSRFALLVGACPPPR
jgi:threonine dehydratase